MFDHVGLRVSDQAESERFYDTVLATLGVERTYSGEALVEWDDFAISPVTEEKPATTGLHIGFAAGSRALVDEFWRAGTGAGYDDDGAPGPRPEYGGDYYGAFLLDPDGNSTEAVHHGSLRAGGGVDHLWIRVADVAAAKAFYERVGLHAGFGLGGEGTAPRRFRFSGGNGSFSVVEGAPAANVHLAFPVDEDARVDAFHAALTGAGYPDNGAPGERPEYHEGYYGAFVLDPDGNNVELVNHNR